MLSRLVRRGLIRRNVASSMFMLTVHIVLFPFVGFRICYFKISGFQGLFGVLGLVVFYVAYSFSGLGTKNASKRLEACRLRMVVP